MPGGCPVDVGPFWTVPLQLCALAYFGGFMAVLSCLVDSRHVRGWPWGWLWLAGSMHQSYCPQFWTAACSLRALTPLSRRVYVSSCVHIYKLRTCCIYPNIRMQCGVRCGSTKGVAITLSKLKLVFKCCKWCGRVSAGCSSVVLASSWVGDMYSACPVLTPHVLEASS